MAIPTSRTKEEAKVLINKDLCNGCGVCVTICSDCLKLTDNKVSFSTETSVFGCIGCGHCMLVCPHDAITIEGRCLTKDDMILLPEKEAATDFKSFLSLLQRRRSIRNFKDKPVEKALIEKVLEAAQTAPMGLPPSDVHVLVLDSKEKVRAFAEDYAVYLEKLKWIASDWFLTIMRPFWGKTNDEMFREFVKPCMEAYTDSMKKGVNIINYDAPVALYFYGSPYADPADSLIAATYAMLAAESLGLGTCMLGAVHPMIQNGGAAKRFREKHCIRYPSREGIFLIMGYPCIKFHKAVKRTFAAVDWI